MAVAMPMGFSRPEGPEDISPPNFNVKTRSFESLSVAEVLQSKLGAGEEAQSSGPSSPPAQQAAAVLQSVTALAGAAKEDGAKSDTDETAIDCLMSLSTAKRKAAEVAAPAPRRRLKMRSQPSPLVPKPSPSPAPPPASGGRGPAKMHSGASVEQLQLLAAAFKLCPAPSAKQLAAIADRVSLPADRLQQWFDSRKVLQDWIQAQPSISAEDILGMFYQQS